MSETDETVRVEEDPMPMKELIFGAGLGVSLGKDWSVVGARLLVDGEEAIQFQFLRDGYITDLRLTRDGMNALMQIYDELLWRKECNPHDERWCSKASVIDKE